MRLRPLPQPLRPSALLPAFSPAIGLALLGLLAGCAATTPQWERQYGQARRAALTLQTLDPDAAHRTPPSQTMDGRAARAAYDRYQRSYAEPPPSPALTIGVSTK